MRVRGILLAALLASGCSSPTPQPARSIEEARPPGWAIIDVDRHGVLLFDAGSRQYQGVSRAGEVVWRYPASAPMATCVGACPDAALSGSLDSLNSSNVPDPAPVLIVGSKTSTLDSRERVLWGVSPRDLVTSDGAMLRLGDLRIAVGGRHTVFTASADGVSAVALTGVASGPSNEARWFTRADGAWRVVGQVSGVSGTRACVAPDGSLALLLGQRPSLLDRAGKLTPVTDLVSAGACAFTRDGVVIAELAQGLGGASRSRLRAVALDAGATSTWSLDLSLPVSVCGDVLSTRFVYVAGGTAFEVDARDGKAARTVRDVSAACFDDAGSLVVVRPDGSVNYLPA